jgi:phage tail-like protein
MRGTVRGLASPHPLGETLPSLYADDSLAQRLCQGLDEVLAPVIVTLDCLPAYLDPATTPGDLLDWLAGWVAVTLPTTMPDRPRRRLVAAAASLSAWRGTVRGLEAVVELATGQVPEIRESGGTTWSPDPHAPLPGSPDALLIISLRADPRLMESRLVPLISGFVPAHLPWRLEFRP